MEVFTVKTANGFTSWKLTPECERQLQPIADQFGMGIKKFLYLYTKGSLPGQLVRHNDIDEQNAPRGFSFSVSACADQTTWDRIKLAARHDRVSIKAFVWQAIASSVNCIEQDMILNPNTGDPIFANCLIEQFMIARERREK